MWSTIYSNGKNWIKGNVELFLAFTGMIGILLAAGNQAVFWPAIQWNVLAILMCLMLILGGLRQAGGIQWVCYHLLRRCHSVKAVCAFFIFSCFISSMVITNDASLLLFVPESIWLFRKLKKDDWLPFLVVLETIAANMGSTLLPSGNPQNLYLYFMYGMKFSDFLKITVPITALSGLLLLGILWGRRNEAMALPQQKAPAVRGRQAALFTLLLGVIFLVLLKTLVWWVAAMVVIPLAVFLDYRLLKQVDWKLLLLFVCLFVFAGNMSHMPWVIRHLTGNPLLHGVFWSQIISNVPAAVLLSSVNTQGGNAGGRNRYWRAGNAYCFHGQPYFLQGISTIRGKEYKGISGYLYRVEPFISGSFAAGSLADFLSGTRGSPGKYRMKSAVLSPVPSC